MTTADPADIDAPRRPFDYLDATSEAYTNHYLDNFAASLEPHIEQWREKAPELRLWFQRWIVDGWLKLDQEALLSVVTDDFVCEDPALIGTDCVGRGAYREFVADMLISFPDAAFHPTDPPFLALDGTQLIIPWRSTGHFSGPMRLPGSHRTIAPTGRRFDVSGVDVYTFRGQQICRLRSLYDGLVVLRQIGITPGIDVFVHRVLPVVQPFVAAIQRRRL